MLNMMRNLEIFPTDLNYVNSLFIQNNSPSLIGFSLNLTFNWCNEQVTFYKKRPDHVTVSDEISIICSTLYTEELKNQ